MKKMKINLVNNFNTDDYSIVINKVAKTCTNVLSLSAKSINIILVDNLAIQELNKKYRNKDAATDVLTFPDGYLNNLGDVFISVDKCTEQALELEHSFNRELGFLTVHGILHSLGYDHLTDEDEKEMNELQDKILNKAKLFR
jgi:probable rRNA maturation factor